MPGSFKARSVPINLPTTKDPTQSRLAGHLAGSVKFPYGVQIKVHRQSGTDRFGNPLPISTHTIDEVAHAPRNTNEITGDRDTVLAGEWLYLQPGADIQPDDRVWLPRDDWNKAAPWFVDGDVQVYDSHPFTDDPERPGSALA